MAALYSDYFNTEKATLIDNVVKNRVAEYYPDGVNGNYELWTPVVKVDV